MRARTFTPLPAIHSSTWAHPYGHGLFDPFLYADGGDSPAEGDAGTTTSSDKPDTGDAAADKDTAGSDSTDWKSEAEKYKALMRKHEARAKENATAAKERDELRKQSMTDQEKAVEEASAKARTEERVRLAGKLARQGFLAAAAGRIPHAASVADDLNLAKYVGEDGEIDEGGLAELVERLAPAKADKADKDGDEGGEKKRKQGGGRGFDQGPRGTGSGDKATSVSAGRDLYTARKKTTSST